MGPAPVTVGAVVRPDPVVASICSASAPTPPPGTTGLLDHLDYDPFHYDVPEGSYATADAQTGWARSKQYREMVKSLHDNGNRVVVDVVYNHGAHAAVKKLRLLTRDVKRYRMYFPTVELIAPDV